MLQDLRIAWIITQREVRDQLRDWRIVFPVIALTVFFPSLMNFTARQAVSFVERYGAPVVAERLFPFLMMVVGFFPISISLVIALESFVGEKERLSIEPLLCTPLSDVQLYLGKLMASTAAPLFASYLGIAVYLIGLYWKVGWLPQPILLIQVLLLTTMQAILMVSGSVVVSSQTTSTRAATLLASFIIIPVALLIEGESMVMFWARYNVLWWAILALLIITGLLVRAGIAYFNREELLGRELDEINFRWVMSVFLSGLRGNARHLGDWLFHEVPHTVRTMRLPALVTLFALALGIAAGISQARVFPLPAELLQLDNLDSNFMDTLRTMGFFSTYGVAAVWLHNLRVIALASLLGFFSFGVMGLIVLIMPIALIAYLATNLTMNGISPIPFLLGLVAPHALLEIPAIFLGGMAILQAGAVVGAPAEGKSVGEAWLFALGRWAKVMFALVLPLFLGAAFIEVFVTPRIAMLLLGN